MSQILAKLMQLSLRGSLAIHSSKSPLLAQIFHFCLLGFELFDSLMRLKRFCPRSMNGGPLFLWRDYSARFNSLKMIFKDWNCQLRFDNGQHILILDYRIMEILILLWSRSLCLMSGSKRLNFILLVFLWVGDAHIYVENIMTLSSYRSFVSIAIRFFVLFVVHSWSCWAKCCLSKIILNARNLLLPLFSGRIRTCLWASNRWRLLWQFSVSIASIRNVQGLVGTTRLKWSYTTNI